MSWSECLIPRGSSTLRAMAMGVHAASFSVCVNTGTSMQAEVGVCKEKSSETQQRGSPQQAAAPVELNFNCSGVGKGARLTFCI